VKVQPSIIDLALFKELGPFSRLLLVIGFGLFWVGALRKFSIYTPELIIGCAAMAMGFSLHYLSSSRTDDIDPPFKSHWSLTNLVWGIVLLGVTAIACYWGYHLHRLTK
jgi:hypothetical protein